MTGKKTEIPDLDWAAERRALLVRTMADLEEKGLHCGSCTGVCCTFVANSVQTTPLETLEILTWLKREGLLTEGLRTRLNHAVTRWRLDVDLPGDGSRNFVRRTYTCPFFGETPRGCGLSRTIKPYGCLGFNPMASGITDGGDCASNIPLLEEREAAFEEAEALENHRLKIQFNLDWEKKPMPVALLALMDFVDG